MLHLFRIVFLCLIAGTSFAQGSFKSINSVEFSGGDKIFLGATPDSLNHYNAFLLANPFISWKLVCSVKNKKTAVYEERNTEGILSALNEQVSNAIEAVTVNDPKQKEPIFYYLQVEAVKAMNLYEARAVVFSSLPEANVLYREYDNLIELDIIGPPRKLFLQTTDSAVTILETTYPNYYTIRIGSTKIRELELIACTVYNNDTIKLDRLRYRVGNLLAPTVYLGVFPLNGPNLKIKKTTFKEMNRLFAKYPPEIPLKAGFDIKKVTMRVGETPYVFEGPKLPEEVKQAIKDAPDKTLIFFDEIQITRNGNPYTRMGNYCFELVD